jgi:DnaK suppressor protein
VGSSAAASPEWVPGWNRARRPLQHRHGIEIRSAPKLTSGLQTATICLRSATPVYTASVDSVFGVAPQNVESKQNVEAETVITTLIRLRDSGELADARKVLGAERVRLLGEAAALAGREQLFGEAQRSSAGGSDGSGSHAADVATEVFEQELAAFLSRNVQTHLTDVIDALGRIDEGVYGLCEDCGEPIDPERLGALPWARRCMPCQSQLEHPVRRPASRRLASAA